MITVFGHFDGNTTKTNTYLWGTTKSWSYSPTSITLTNTPGERVTMGTIVLTAASGKYFDTSQLVTVSYARYDSNTVRTSDFEVSSANFTDSSGNATNNTPTRLVISLTDTDFANGSTVPAGIDSDTTIFIGAGTITGSVSSGTGSGACLLMFTNNSGSTINPGNGYYYTDHNGFGPIYQSSPIGAGHTHSKMGIVGGTLNTSITVQNC